MEMTKCTRCKKAIATWDVWMKLSDGMKIIGHLCDTCHIKALQQPFMEKAMFTRRALIPGRAQA
jgi:hypothetical protein